MSAPQSPVPFTHTTVLLHETVDGVLTRPDGVYVDGTFGRGGHSRLLLSRLSPHGRLIAIDRDPEAIAAATQGQTRVEDPRFSICHAPFADLAAQLAALEVTRIDGLMLDLGVSSPQIDNPERGFSFRFDGPLDMRMDTTRGESAADFLAHADVSQIATVIRDYGEERFALPIAKALVARRESGRPVRSTAELSQVVAGAVKTREPGQDPATRTFQALRIFVNAELEELQQGLKAALALLAPGGRLAVISFHSLEDRIVKNFIAAHSREEVDRRAPFAAPKPLPLRAVARIKPSEAEVKANPRARSAILRVAERTDAPYVAEVAPSGKLARGARRPAR
ncbi:16S rRNA (cytosine(1402)-N(4))-methyltransferase RsmH [Pelomonas sp. CA6]|uniref:16S rRNA (cytosine(1402)-N(4))-methyltransferase RsmH n=1 Tax=Pelomonas sp. CA6 TaxID=2907999 RepID=UPI001F4A2598|nr:16S rRNA (cytosine(1402)-N(4))-methyltransferase RsmH [Pelomonas sp. CA6]MCH7341850.1 16S rRNA (cytosine(1402)-N(4))-methyltransferase RsmH [Pelomonas sp. CA6]